jgi:hypothetical protein
MSEGGERVVVIVGTGAVSGAWDPVLRALQTNGFPDVVSADGANFALARMVYIGRGICLRKELKDAPAILASYKAKLIGLRRAITLELGIAREHLRVRPPFRDVMEQVVRWPAAQVTFATTNWDDAVARALAELDPQIRCHHLHGTCDDPERLYLPTEIVEEPYRDDSEASELQTRRKHLTYHVDKAHRIVLYGVSLSPLDVELAQILASGMAGRTSVRELRIVDPNYPAIAERVMGVTYEGNPDVRVFGTHPARLSEAWLYEPKELERERERCKALDAERFKVPAVKRKRK